MERARAYQAKAFYEPDFKRVFPRREKGKEVFPRPRVALGQGKKTGKVETRRGKEGSEATEKERD